MNEHLQRYADLRRQIQDLEAELEKCKKDATQHVQENGGKVESDTFAASFRSRSTWKYSDAVDKMKEDLKTLRKQEEESGTATKEEGAGYLVLKFKDE